MEIYFKKFNQLNTKELYAILKLRQEVFVLEQEIVYLDTDDKDFESIHLMINRGNELFAYCRILPKGVNYENYLSIGRVVVSPKYRRKNYGKELMKQAINFCKNKFTEKEIKISAQLYLNKFYSDLGFEIISEMYLEDTIPHVAMVLKW